MRSPKQRTSVAHFIRLALGLGIGSLAIPATSNVAWAQPGAASVAPGLTATAIESIPIKAERLRLVMVIQAKGADPKAAIVALSEHKQRVQKELEAMKADAKSIQFTSTRLGSGGQEAAQMQQAIAQMRMSQPGGAASKNALPTVHTAMCGLKAEWPLPSSEGDALALLPVTLNEQIKTRDIEGVSNKPKLSKAAQEQLEELESMVSERYGYQNDSDPSAKIMFVAAMPEEVKKKATAAAFAKANKEVESLAESTGQKRGKLLSLTSDNPLTNSYSQMVQAYSGMYGQADSSSATILTKLDDEKSITSPNADDLTLTVSVTVVYGIE